MEEKRFNFLVSEHLICALFCNKLRKCQKLFRYIKPEKVKNVTDAANPTTQRYSRQERRCELASESYNLQRQVL